MAIRQRGSSWQWDKMVQGVRRRETFASQKEAKEHEKKVVDAMLAGDPYPCPKDPTSGPEAEKNSKKGSLRVMAELTFKKHWQFDKFGNPGKNIKKARINLELMMQHFGEDCMVKSIGTYELDAWIDALKAKGNANGTINRKLAVLGKVLRQAIRENVIDTMPVIERPKEGGGRIRWLSDEEETAVLNTLRRWEKHDHVDTIICLLDTGMRPSELYGLTKRDIDLKTGMVTAWDTKTGKPRSVRMTKRVREIMMRRHNYATPFPYDNEWMRNGWDRARNHLGFANDPHFVPYICRHTCASRLAQRGVRLQVIKEWLGHSDMQMTMRYAHLSPGNLEEAAQALEMA
jgi:integrase